MAQIKSSKQQLAFFLHYVKPNLGMYLIGGVFMLAGIGIRLQVPLVLRTGIDFITARFHGENFTLPRYLALFSDTSAPTQILITLGIILVMLTLLEGGLWALSRILAQNLSLKTEYTIRNDFLAHLQKMSPAFFQQNKTGELMSRATSDIQSFSAIFGNGIYQPLNIIVTFISTLLIMSHINLQITLLALVPLPFTLLLTYWMMRRIKQYVENRQEQEAKLTATAQENFSGTRTIKSYAREDFEITRFAKENKKLVKHNLKVAKVDAFFDFGIEFMFEAGFAMIILVGGLFVINGKISLGEMVAMFSYTESMTWPMIALGWMLNMWQQGLVSSGRLNEILTIPPEIQDHSKTDTAITQLTGAIEFEHVSFTYPNAAEPVLRDVSFRVPAGSICAIVGPTGCGKTTLVNFIPRLIEPSSGIIRIDGKNIQDIPLQVLRQHIGYVQQDHFLFSDTLQANIAFGILQEQQKQIRQAVENSQLLKDLDQFPEGLETIIGERGITLSGGQQQRTSIARAIIRQPAVLILDDALSSVDTETEEAIFNGIQPMMHSRTTLIVSHRISTVHAADQILFIEDGKIAEQGTHAELLQLNGHYAQMFTHQQLEEALQRGLA